MTAPQVLLVLAGVGGVGAIAGALGGRPVVGGLIGLVGGAMLSVVLHMTNVRALGHLLERTRALTGAPRSHVGHRTADWATVAGEIDAAARRLSRRLDELAADRSRMLGLLEGLPPAILLFAADGLSYANASARQIFRLDPPAAAPASRPTPIQVVGVRVLADAVERTRSDGVEAEVEARREDRYFFARTSRTAEGEVALVVTDLTEARRLDAIRRDFVTNASHELKTPVAGIQALAESLDLAVARDPQRAQRMVSRIQSEAARLATLVRELLDLARVEELALARPTNEVDVGAVARSQIEGNRAAARERHVSLESSLARGARVLSAPEDVRLIVDNLLQNAIRYNRPGGEVFVRVSPEDDRVVLEVTDTGIGIPASDRERVFERFYRVDKARSRAAGGTGLGLSLVRHAAQRLGGHVSLTSVLGEGSTFRVELPSAATVRAEGPADLDTAPGSTAT